jgi:hypothetical protein
MRALLVGCLLLGACTKQLVVGESFDAGAVADAPADATAPATACPPSPPQPGDPCAGSLCCEYGAPSTCCNVDFSRDLWRCASGQFVAQSLDLCATSTTCPAGGLPLTAGPRCAAGPQRMLVTPTLLDFGTPFVGDDLTRSFAIANVGGAPLTVSTLALIEDVTTGAFSLHALALPFTIAPGDVEQVTVELKPNSEQLPTGTIKVHSDDPDPMTVGATIDLVSHVYGTPALSVCAVCPSPPPDCTTLPSGDPVIDFGALSCGATVERVVVLTNSGDTTMPLEILSVGLTDPTFTWITVSLFHYVDDPANPGHPIEQPVVLPYYIGHGTADAGPPSAPTDLRIHVRYAPTLPDSGGGTSLRITCDLAGQSVQLTLPYTAQVVCAPPDAGADQ